MFCQAEREVRRGRRGRHPREVGHRPLPQNGRVRSETVRSVSPCSPGNRSRGNDWRELHLDAFEQRRVASVQLWNACLGMRQVPLLRKEVIQPHLPVRLPCYDLTPITDPTFDGSFLAVRPPASGVTNFRGLTGGVYKARERIHPGNADPGLLATPTSCRRVAACNLN